MSFDTPQELSDWIMGGHSNGHANHQRFAVHCDYKPLYESARGRGVEFRVGQEFVFVTRLGKDDQVIALGPDGRISFFDRVSPLTHELTEGLRVRAEIMLIGDRWMIARPIEVVGMALLLDIGLARPFKEGEGEVGWSKRGKRLL